MSRRKASGFRAVSSVDSEETTRKRVSTPGSIGEASTFPLQTPTLPYQRGLRGEGPEQEGERRSSGRMRTHQRARSRYVLAGQIASGGMATVHLALQQGAEGFHRVVALKQIHPHLARHREFCQMFIDEARIAARINHPSVCRIFDFGRGDEGYFLAMEYLAGEPLSRIVRAVSKRADIRESARYPLLLARIFSNLAEGLYAAHTLTNERGEPLHVVHRDVTPQNLFVLYDGSVRITDFGIVHARQRVHQTEGNFLKGKLAYMAPEQLERKPVDHRADLWALGVVLWECLTFQRLFQGRSEGEILMQVMSAEILPPSMRNANVPRAIDAVVERALARDPEQRYASARELSRDLEQCLGMAHDTVPTMDVAEWMRDVFPGGNERVAQIVKSALLLSSIPPPSSEGFSSFPPAAASYGGVLTPLSDSGDDAERSEAERSDAEGSDAEGLRAEGRGPDERIVERDVAESADAEPRASTPGANAEPRASTDDRKPTAAVAPKHGRARRTGWLAAAFLLAAGTTAGYAIVTAPAKHAPSESPTGNVPAVEARKGVAVPASAPASRSERASDAPSVVASSVVSEPAKDTATPSAVVSAPSKDAADAPRSKPELDAPSAPASSAVAAVTQDAPRAAPVPRAAETTRATKPAPRPEPVVAPRVGSVALSTPQGVAEIFENGVYLGKTPARLTLPVGRHTLVVRPSSGAPERTVVVEVTAGALSFVTVDIPPPATTRSGGRP